MTDDGCTKMIRGTLHRLYGTSNPSTGEFLIDWWPDGTSSVPLKEGWVFDGAMRPVDEVTGEPQ